MQILSASKTIINQLIKLCDDLSDEQYAVSLDLLMQNSIGKHIRHIVEFYDILRDSCLQKSELSYDKREHCIKTEREKCVAVSRFKEVLKWFDQIDTDAQLKLMVSYDKLKKDGFEINTSLERELVYNIEHAIHHMAIIRIAIEKEFTDIKLNEDFGVAYSTIRFRDDLCAH